MVFVIQNTQNRDQSAIQIKLDELIRATKEAQDSLLDLEEMDDKDLERLRGDYERLAKAARRRNGDDVPCPNGPDQEDARG
jgi:low affinity Fe/Cu permease